MAGGWRLSWRRRRVISRRVVGRRREIGLSIIAIVIGRRSRERPERRGYDRRGGADDSARRTERPEQWKWRTRRIILSLGVRNRHSAEPGRSAAAIVICRMGMGVSRIGLRAAA